MFDGAGELVAEAFATIATRRSTDAHVEHDPLEIVDSLRQAIDDVAGQIDVASLSAAGLATQRSSIVCWDRTSGEPLSPVLSWQDRRNAAFVERLREREQRIHERTGLVLSAHYGASKLRWCLENLESVRDAAHEGRLAMGPLASFLLFRLIEERPLRVDPANASRTQLWDPTTRDWAPDLLELFGVPAHFLPEPAASRSDFGSLPVGDRRVPLTVCTGDQSTVPYAFGPADRATAYVNMGTGAFIQIPLDEPRRVWPLLTSVVWADASAVTYVLEASVNGASSALDWLSETEGVDAHRAFAALTLEGSRSLTPPLFLNGVSGLGSPFWKPNFPSVFLGRGTAEEKLLAVLESILFLVRVNLQEMRAGTSSLRRIVVTGGLSRSDVLCQRLADLTALDVLRYPTREATSRGLAFLTAGQPSGWQPGHPDTFEPRRDTALLERFFAWLKEMKRAASAEDA